MVATRLNPVFVTPRYEDAGLFKADICRLAVNLTPAVRRNARADYIFDGVIDGKYRVPIFFGGRRAVLASAVLDAMRTVLRAPVARDIDLNALVEDDRVVLPLQVDGAWRTVVREDAQGFARATHHFIAAAWTIGVGGDRPLRFGTMPVR